MEDNPDHRLLERKSLETLGAGTEVLAVSNAVEGARGLNEQHFDLVIADYQMPGMDGLTFLRTLNQQGIDVPVVIVTGVGSEGIAVEALKLGAQDYLLKDMGYLDLLPSVAGRAIASSRSKKQLQQARRQLAESEQRYRDLVHGVDAIVWEADLETWEFSFVSERAQAILGYPLDQWLLNPQFWTEILHPEDRQGAMAVDDTTTNARPQHLGHLGDGGGGGEEQVAEPHILQPQDIVEGFDERMGEVIECAGPAGSSCWIAAIPAMASKSS